MDEHRIRAEWTRPIKYDKVLVYETNAKGTKYNDAVGSSKGWRYTFEGLKPSTRKYIRVRGIKTINGCKCFTNYTRVDYGQTSNDDLAKLRKEIADWLIDGLFIDAFTLSKISKSQKQMENLKKDICKKYGFINRKK